MCNNNASLELNKTRLIASFLENARLFPDQEAVVDGEQSITYAELDAVSNRIAARLQRSYSQTPEQPVKVVGVLLPRSIGNVACWLGSGKGGHRLCPYRAGLAPGENSGHPAPLQHKGRAHRRGLRGNHSTGPAGRGAGCCGFFGHAGQRPRY